MMPPVPVQSTSREVRMGNVSQMHMPAQVVRDEARSTVTQHMPTTTAVREVGQAVYVTGPTVEEDGAAQVSVIHQEQLIMGEVQQQIVEIPTIQVEETIEEIPEVQIRQILQEVPQIMQEQVEQLVEQILQEVPQIM